MSVRLVAGNSLIRHEHHADRKSDAMVLTVICSLGVVSGSAGSDKPDLQRSLSLTVCHIVKKDRFHVEGEDDEKQVCQHDAELNSLAGDVCEVLSRFPVV